jgi:hypothetical protein
MTLLRVLRWRLLLGLAVLVGCVGLTALGAWRMGGSASKACGAGTQPPTEKQTLQERIRKGVGS